jgi:flagellar biosynthesis/type III secretory pathway protein FliH
MSFRAVRLSDDAAVTPFDWGATFSSQTATDAGQPFSAEDLQADSSRRLPDQESMESIDAEVERDAFVKGYAQGEKAGAEAAAKRGEGMLRRLKETIEELTALRSDILHRSERQMVQLALAISRRIVMRELSVDRGLLVGMARAALDRLGEHAQATIRLHPDDFASAGPAAQENDGRVKVEADPHVARGSCRVESDFGFMDVSADAQFEELARVLLEDETQPSSESQTYERVVIK